MISGRAGRGIVGTTSGLSFCATPATESGLVAPTPLLQISERVFPPLIPFPVGKLLPVGILVPVYRRNFGYSLSCDRSTMELVVSARLTSAERVATGVGSSYRGAGT